MRRSEADGGSAKSLHELSGKSMHCGLHAHWLHLVHLVTDPHGVVHERLKRSVTETADHGTETVAHGRGSDGRQLWQLWRLWWLQRRWRRWRQQ